MIYECSEIRIAPDSVAYIFGGHARSMEDIWYGDTTVIASREADSQG